MQKYTMMRIQVLDLLSSYSMVLIETTKRVLQKYLFSSLRKVSLKVLSMYKNKRKHMFSGSQWDNILGCTTAN